jgi:hypothetical protein
MNMLSEAIDAIGLIFFTGGNNMHTTHSENVLDENI